MMSYGESGDGIVGLGMESVSKSMGKRLTNEEMIREAELLRKARQLDEQALAEVYDAFNQEIFRYACGLLGNADLAEECVAETFSRFLIAVHNGGGAREYLRAYLYRIAHNWVSDLYRRRSPAEQSLDENLSAAARLGGRMEEAGDPAETVIDALERQELRQALMRLTEEQRQVVTLKYLGNLENVEIAQTLDKPIGAVKSLQHRGLAALRRMLYREENVQKEEESNEQK
jgi:RNA polymerase sigma-70 factor (ECF subfamily)